MKQLLSLILLCCCFYVSAQSPVTPGVDGSGNLYFQVANVYFQVNPKHGARIESYTLGGSEFLYVEHNPGIEDMYGSTAWLSPQSLWNWPPQKQIDSDPYTGGISGDKIILTSGIATAGSFKFQIRKTFSASLQDTSVSVNYTVINKSTSVKSIASWEIFRVPTGGISLFPINGSVSGELSSVFEYSGGVAWWDYDSTNNTFNKAFADGKDGWLAHINNDRIIHIKKFTDSPSNFPGNSEKEVEFWAESGRRYNEIEKHSEYKSVAANDSTSLSMKWYLRKLPDNIEVKEGNAQIISYITSLLKSASVGIDPVITRATPAVYPNPSDGFIYISGLKDGESCEFSLYNVLGKKMTGLSLREGEKTDLSILPGGFYIYRIMTGTGLVTGRLVLR
jgi:hypothetical protein